MSGNTILLEQRLLHVDERGGHLGQPKQHTFVK
jgi:hypothetical protein